MPNDPLPNDSVQNSAPRCDSWSQFKVRIIQDLFPDGHFRRGRYLFRGQGSDSWALSATFDRWYRGPKDQKLKVAERLLDEFMYECEGDDIPDNLRSDRLHMLGLAQHNGMPTRMLDWTESPYVAAFFAFSGHIRQGLDLDKCVGVSVLDTTSHIWQREFGCEIVSMPSFGNDRLRSQYGRFTYLRAPYDSLDEYVTQFPGESPLKKYSVPVRDVEQALADLDAMGINHSRIYPGIMGNARAAEMRVILNPPS
jgi:hypothetical protein